VLQGEAGTVVELDRHVHHLAPR
jgi:hypothetical protein